MILPPPQLTRTVPLVPYPTLFRSGNVRPYDYYISRPQPAYYQRYRETELARWHFEAQQMPGIRIVIDADLMDRSAALSDRSALEMAEARCEALLERVAREEGLAAWVLMMLTEARDGMPTLDELAHIQIGRAHV